MMSDRGYSVRPADLSESLSTFKRNCTDSGIVTDPGRLIIRVQRVFSLLLDNLMLLICFDDIKMTRMRECGVISRRIGTPL